MLEMSDGTVSPQEQVPATTAPPRRRRAASRPAGPPATPAPSDPTPAAPAAAEPAQAAAPEASPAAEPVTAPAAEPVAAEAPAPQEDAAPPTRRRRAATKAAGEPAAPRRRRVKAVEHDGASAVEATPESAPEPGQPEEIAPTTAAPAAEAPAAEAPAPTRRRATRRTAPPAEADRPAASQEAPASDAAPADAAPPTDADPAAAADRALHQLQDATPAPVVDEAVTTPAPSRRRRATRPTAPPQAPAETDEDPIAAALRAAEEVAEARRAVLSDPFLTASARDQQLADLAGAIAAGPEDEVVAEEEQTEALAGIADQPEAADDVADADDDIDEDVASDEEDVDAEGGETRRRRRRRGGRRRRRVGSRDESDETGAESDADESPESEGAEGESAEGEPESETETDESGSTRRRRRRRRRGDAGDASSIDDEVTGIEGSTRMEAKRQRRKESRAAGRRRAPILSEAEFLARRESVDRRLVIRQAEDYTQLAVVEDNILVEHYVDKASATSLIGNIYIGRVQNVLPSMEAAFIDIGRGRNAVLYAGEVDWALFGVTGENRKVENVLKSGQSVLVQVTKDPVGAKGARLTGHISLPGRYIVYSPGGHLSGISRKLPDTERARLRGILATLISDEESVIVRTAAEGVSEEELVRDVNRLKAQWEVIEKKSKQGSAPQALYSEPDLTLRIVRDLFTEDFAQLVVQGNGGPEDAYDAISAYVGHVAPHLADRVSRFQADGDDSDVFAQFKIDEQIAKALDRKVYLPSGGSLVIDRTEAMTVIDVNTGRFTGSGGNLEATVTSNNLEAAEEIVRQLRLRDLGGIIVIDFIDMVLPSNRDLLLRRLVECLGRDRTRHQVAEVTSLGLVQLTRKRIGTGLQEAFTEQCEHCHGAGYVRFEEPVDSQSPSDGGERKPRRRGKK
ncbi:Ribonuclease E [Tessaracoccus sp. O5.2]|uniref:Rne/Rng family ribonuclease n=1 Tax=Tessaracoccus sp. O5.2 TaxID=3157622 RepID=UPI0035F0425A